MESGEMDMWGESWSTSDSEESGSSYSEDSNSSLRMEAVRVGGENLLLPQGLCDRSDVFRELLSMDTWQNFSEHQREHLKTFLPSFPENDCEEKDKTLKMLFSRENLRFGNPLTEFHGQLKAAYFRPDVSKMRALLRKAKYRDYKRGERWRYFELVKAVLGSRQRLVDAIVNGEKPRVLPGVQTNMKKPRRSHAVSVKSRYFHELALIREEVGESSQSSEDDNYPEGCSLGLSKKGKRQGYLTEQYLEDGYKPVLGTLSPGPSPWNQGRFQQNNPYATIDQSYTQLLVAHSRRRAKREDHPSLYTEGISLNDVALRCKFLKRPSMNHKPITNKKAKVKIPRTPSVSSPMVEDCEMDDSSASDGTMIGLKQDTEEEGERVDIEGVDDLPSVPMVIRTGLANANPMSSPKSSKVVSGGLAVVPRRIKTEPNSEIISKRSSTEHSELHIKKGKECEVSRQRKSKATETNTIEVHGRKIKVEPIETISKKIKVEPIDIDHHQIQNTKIKIENVESHAQSVFPVLVKSASTRVMTPATLSDLDGIDMMDLPVDFDESSAMSLDDMKPRPELMQETHACFFSLIRDILTSTPDHRIEMRELEGRVRAWASSPIGPINHWYTPHLESQLASAVQFLAGDSSEIVPEDYVPYMEYKVGVGAYQWIGAGRDSDHRLVALCTIWLERGADRGPCKPLSGATGATTGSVISGLSNERTEDTTPLPPRGPALQPTPQRDRDLFRTQEKLRYERPYRAFTYNVAGTWTTVGPVRNCNNIRARGHSLLVESRPKCVSILELVRDAVARLPNGQGTRADIVTLLKDSQFLLDNAPEGMLSSGVSGALDKLHSEPDPCVKYDPKRKTWVYLHRGRTQEEFERLHALGVDMKVSRPRPPRKPAKPKKDAQPKEDSAATASIMGKSEGETSVVTIRAGGDVSGGPLVVQARGTGGKSVTLTSSRKVLAEGVKSLLGTKARTIDHQQQQVKTSGELVKTVAVSSSLPTRTLIQEATISVPTSQQLNVMKKAPQSVTISTEQVQKQGSKSIVKVITNSQSSTVNTVRTVQRPSQVTPQQVIHLKQQLLADQQKLLQQQKQQAAAAAAGKKPGLQQTQQGQASGTKSQPQQQLIVMKQAGSGDQGTPQQMIVINQQQVVMDPQLTAKQQKQLQQLITKQQLEQQGGVTIQQQQLQQLILAKQQQQQQQQQGLVVEGKQQGSSGGGTKVVGTTSSGGGQQMIVVKQTGSSGSGGGGGGEKGQGLQQMILLKQGGQGGETHHITQQQLQQMLLLKQQQQQQQMIIVKQDQKAVQVIAQPTKGQPQQITLAQLQQLQQQQQQQQRSSATTSLLTHPRVVTHVSSASGGGTSLIKPQTPGGVVAKVVSNPQVVSMESLLQKPQSLQQQGTVRMPAVSRAIPSQQYTVVSVPQQRVVQTTNVSQATSSTVVSGVTVTTGDQSGSPKFVTAGANMRIPGLNLAQIAGKQVLLASKPQSIQGQNVILGNSGGGTVLVASQGTPGQQGTLTVLQQGSQQILLPPGALNLKALQGLKVIPLAKQPQGKQQVFARIINPGSTRPVVASMVHQDPQPPSTKE